MKSIEVKNLPQECENCNSKCYSAFKDLTPIHSQLIDSIRQIKVVKQGEKIFVDSFFSDEFYCVNSGHLRVDFSDGNSFQSVRICGPGDLVGFKMTQAYSVTALEDAALCAIDSKAFQNLQNSIPALSIGVIQSLVKTISDDDERIRGLGNYSIKNRIASTLLDLSKKFGVFSSEGKLIDLNLDRKTLARMSGTVVESLARVLTDFEEANLILRQGRKIIILDDLELKKIAES